MVWCLVTKSCPTVAHQDPLSMGFFLASILEWVDISFSRGSSRPRDQTQVSCTTGRFFTDWTTREAPIDSCFQPFNDNFTLNVFTTILGGKKEIFKREALEKLKSSATFGKMTPLMAKLWKSRMKCYVRKLQPASKYFTHYIFFLRINALLELKAKFCGNKLILKENSK